MLASMCFTLPKAVPTFPRLVPTPTLHVGKGKAEYTHFTDQKEKSYWVPHGWGLTDALKRGSSVTRASKVRRIGRLGSTSRHSPVTELAPAPTQDAPTQDVLHVRNDLPENGPEGRPCG